MHAIERRRINGRESVREQQCARVGFVICFALPRLVCVRSNCPEGIYVVVVCSVRSEQCRCNGKGQLLCSGFPSSSSGLTGGVDAEEWFGAALMRLDDVDCPSLGQSVSLKRRASVAPRPGTTTKVQVQVPAWSVSLYSPSPCHY